MGDLKTILDTVTKQFPQKELMGQRQRIVNAQTGEVTFGEYQWKTFKEVHTEAYALANYLEKHSLCPKVVSDEGVFRFISLYSKNRVEWAVSDFACCVSGITSVCLYDTLGKESIDYTLEQCKIKTVICSSDKVKNIADIKKEGKLTTVTHVIYFSPSLDQSVIELSNSVGLTLVQYEEALKEGLNIKDVEFDKVTPDTFYTFSYTSGTTGMPKGVMLTHRNFVSNLAGLQVFDGVFKVRDDDVYYSYLPLAHVFERCILLLAVANKMKIGFYQGDVLKLKEDLAILRPTFMISVPRLYNRFYDLMQ